MEAWPSSLPQKVSAEFDISFANGLNSEDAEINPERTRTYPERETTLKVIMTLEQLSTFRTFWDTTLNQGAPFTAPWLEAMGFAFHFLRFVDAPSWENSGGGYWTVSLPVEIIAGVETDSGGDPEIYPPED